MFGGGNLISWESKKKCVVYQASAESEYRVMTQFVCKIMWLHQLLMEVGIKTPVPTKLMCDHGQKFRFFRPIFRRNIVFR